MGFFASLDYALLSVALVLEFLFSCWIKTLPAFNGAPCELQLIKRVKLYNLEDMSPNVPPLASIASMLFFDVLNPPA